MVIADAAGNPVPSRTLDLASANLAIVGTVEATRIDLNVGAMLFA
jgi:hypothetical protein